MRGCVDPEGSRRVPPRQCLCQRVSSHPATVQCGGSKAWTHFKTTLKSRLSSRAFRGVGRGHLSWLQRSLPSQAAVTPSQVSSSGSCLHARTPEGSRTARQTPVWTPARSWLCTQPGPSERRPHFPRPLLPPFLLQWWPGNKPPPRR